MGIVVEYVMVRPDCTVDFPVLTEEDQAAIDVLREKYGIVSSTKVSDDGLTWTMRQSASEVAAYGSYYKDGKKHWDKSRVVARCGELNIDISLNFIENT